MERQRAFLGAWVYFRKKQDDSQKVQSVVSRKIAELRENKAKLEERSSIKRRLTKERITRCAPRSLEELALAEMELREIQAEEIEIETTLDYLQMVLTNASNLWKAAQHSKNSVCSRFSSQRVLPIWTGNIEPL